MVLEADHGARVALAATSVYFGASAGGIDNLETSR
jgi:hypothetical protein